VFLSAYVLLLLDISSDRCFLGDGPGEIGQVRSFFRCSLYFTRLP